VIENTQHCDVQLEATAAEKCFPPSYGSRTLGRRDVSGNTLFVHRSRAVDGSNIT